MAVAGWLWRRGWAARPNARTPAAETTRLSPAGLRILRSSPNEPQSNPAPSNLPWHPQPVSDPDKPTATPPPSSA